MIVNWLCLSCRYRTILKLIPVIETNNVIATEQMKQQAGKSSDDYIIYAYMHYGIVKRWHAST